MDERVQGGCFTADPEQSESPCRKRVQPCCAGWVMVQQQQQCAASPPLSSPPFLSPLLLSSLLSSPTPRLIQCGLIDQRFWEIPHLWLLAAGPGRASLSVPELTAQLSQHSHCPHSVSTQSADERQKLISWRSSDPAAAADLQAHRHDFPYFSTSHYITAK